MSADGSATVFCFTPRRVPLDELLKEQEAAHAVYEGATLTSDSAPPQAISPWPPVLAQKLEPFRSGRSEMEPPAWVAALRQEVAQLRAEVARWQRENLELWQQVGYWQSRHRDALKRVAA